MKLGKVFNIKFHGQTLKIFLWQWLQHRKLDHGIL